MEVTNTGTDLVAATLDGNTKFRVDANGIVTTNDYKLLNGTSVTGSDSPTFEHKRQQSCTAQTAGQTCSTDVIWTTPFSDTNFNVVCSLDTKLGQPYIINFTKLLDIASVNIAPLVTTPFNGEINCIGVHD